ncbi:unnamed protein product [Linum trigynum]|uniref:Uncharacterized protein n=1 Tax=Linum trigynum TaxID=586398 RepID=A0AAV2GMA1_9ROSI
MEMLLIREDLEEDCEATIARFLQGLSRLIINLVEIQPFVELYDLVAMAAKLRGHNEATLKEGSYLPQVHQGHEFLLLQTLCQPYQN